MWQHVEQFHVVRSTPPDKAHADLYRPLYASPPPSDERAKVIDNAETVLNEIRDANAKREARMYMTKIDK